MSDFALTYTIEDADPERLAILAGHTETHIRQIEQTLHIQIHNQHDVFHLMGEEEAVTLAKKALIHLYEATATQSHFSAHDIHLALCSLRHPHAQDDHTILTTQKRRIKARSPQQAAYLKALAHDTIHFGIGPSGTGKTFLAVAQAVHALESQQVNKIVLARPAVEAGESLGFLPGDMAQKVDPYLRPLYDALHTLLSAEHIKHCMERRLIEIAPLAYMRGRTLSESFIILDEAQNTTPLQLKMFITRLGMRSQLVITGDLSQVDLPKPMNSGLQHAIKLLSPLEDIGVTTFSIHDVVRHPLLEKVIRAYETEENKNNLA